jgi:hypothetical protein
VAVRRWSGQTIGAHQQTAPFAFAPDVVDPLAGQNLRAVEVPAISDDIEMVTTKSVLGLRCDIAPLLQKR